MMNKNSAEHIPCTYCGEDAIDGTNPPVCARHMDKTMTKEASEKEADTLKELDNKEQ